MASWKAGGDGKPVSFPTVPWHKAGSCPVMKEPCGCKLGSFSRSLCVDMASRSQNDESPR